MSDDSDLKEEYIDYSKYSLRSASLDEEDRELLRELNKLRYRFNMGYISEDKFFSQINYPEFFGFLSAYEWAELQKRADEEKRLIKQKEEIDRRKYKLKKERKEELNQIFTIISILILFILILIGLTS